MRLLLTGKTRSGKSTTLHQLLSHILHLSCWQEIILLDGKGVELNAYARLRLNIPLLYYGPNELDQWERALGRMAVGLEARYQRLGRAGLREANAHDKRMLLVIDEVQIGCRDSEHGRSIKQHLTRIAEQSAALHDVVVMTCQREQNSVPPAVRWNCSAKLRMLSGGFFHYQPDGLPNVSGKIPYIAPAAALERLSTHPAPATDDPPAMLTAETLLTVLEASHSNEQRTSRANATLYLGSDGSGKSYQLEQHSGKHTTRRILVDLLEGHRAWLRAILETCSATPPVKASVAELTEMAVLAVRAEPTTLLLDNIDHANVAARKSILDLINAADVCALSSRLPETPSLERKINPFISRCTVVRIRPLTTEEAVQLTDTHLPPHIPRRRATRRRIVDMGSGHPGTIVNLCHQAENGSLRELRHLENTPRRFNLVWMLLIPIIILLLIWRYRIDSYLASALLITLLMLLRPLIYRSVRQTAR